MVETLVRSVCPHDCPDMCSFIATVRDGQLVGVRGDPDQPFTQGFLCGKVQHYEERVHSPDRLLTPLRRVGPKGAGSFEPTTWDAALELIADRWRLVIAEHGSEALVGYAYSGNQGLVNRNVVRALFHALGASRFDAGTVCDSTCGAAWEYAVGPTPGTDPETVVDSDLVLCWGANLATTNVHMLPLIDRARERGAQLVVIDPYRTRTARRADWHIAPRIGSDAALALAMMHVIVREGLHDAAFLAEHAIGFERLRDEVLPHYPPARAASLCGMTVEDIERLALLYAHARAPYLRLGMGMSRNTNGGMLVRTVACLPALVGAWAKPGGGALQDTAAIWEFDYDAVRRPDMLRKPVRSINHSQLGRALIELRDPPVMALFVAANNPAVTCPDQARIEAGLRREDLFTVVHDSFMTDTARFADVVLPAATAVEGEDLYRSYGSYYVQYGPRLIAPVGEARTNLTLVQSLAARLGLSDPFFARDERAHMAALLDGAHGPVANIALDCLLAGGAIKMPPPTVPPTTFFYSDAMARDGLPPLPEWQPDPVESDEGARWPLRLLTGPGHFQHHTAFDGVDRLQRREGDPACLIHPEEAARRGLADGDAVALMNDRGHAGMRVRVTSDAQPGTAVVIEQRNRGRYLSGGPLNVLTSDALADMGGGATYQSTWVDCRPLSTIVR